MKREGSTKIAEAAVSGWLSMPAAQPLTLPWALLPPEALKCPVVSCLRYLNLLPHVKLAKESRYSGPEVQMMYRTMFLIGKEARYQES